MKRVPKTKGVTVREMSIREYFAEQPIFREKKNRDKFLRFLSKIGIARPHLRP
jgi:hypothetical protein